MEPIYFIFGIIFILLLPLLMILLSVVIMTAPALLAYGALGRLGASRRVTTLVPLGLLVAMVWAFLGGLIFRDLRNVAFPWLMIMEACDNGWNKKPNTICPGSPITSHYPDPRKRHQRPES